LRPPPRVALIVPCYNEEMLVDSTCTTLLLQLDELIAQDLCTQNSYVLFVDDGSSDATWAAVEKLAAAFPRKVRGISLATNSGHQFALIAGIDFAVARSDVSISLDADLQDDPAVIAEMIAAYRSGAEIVLGVRRTRKADTLFKRLSASGYYKLLRFLGVNTVAQHADFRLLSRSAMQNLRKFPEYHLFLRGFPKLLHNRIAIVPYDRAPRLAGNSKYPLLKMLGFAWTGVTSFSVVPLRIISFAGAAVFLISVVLFIYAIAGWLSGSVVPGWASITAPLYALGGMLMLSIGVVGEYVGKVYEEVKRRPRYLVDRVAGEGGALERED
jgi:glycosyltransferase involved in cell wall biosynthesis